MTIELTARHRDHEGNALWEMAETCQCCGKAIIDVWSVSVDGKIYSAVGRECMKKVAGFVHPSDYKKAEANYFKARRKQEQDAIIADGMRRGLEATDEQLIAIIRTKVREHLQQSWIDGLSDPNVRGNLILMAA